MIKAVDKVISLILRLCLPVTAFLVPLFFLPLTLDFFGFNKQYLIAVIASICLLCFLIKNLLRGQIRLSLTPSTVSLLLLSLVFILSSALQSSTPTISLLGKTSLLVSLTIIFISVTSLEKDAALFFPTIYALTLSTAIIALTSLASLTGATASLPAWANAKSFNLTGGNVPFLTLAFDLIPALLYLSIVSKKSFIKITLLVACGIITISSISQINYLISVKPPLILHLPLAAGWSIALDIFKNWRTAIIGTGPETFLNIFSHLKPAFLNQGDLWNVRFGSSTNEILELITTVGFLGILFFFLALYRPIKTALTEAKTKKLSPQLIFSLILTGAGFICLLIVPASVVLYLTLFLGLILLNLCLKEETDSVKELAINVAALSPNAAGETKKRSYFLPTFFLILGLFGLLFYGNSAARAYLANSASYQATQVIQKNATEGYNLQIKAYQLDPYNSLYRVSFSQTSMALANQIAQNKNLSEDDKKNVTQLIQQAIREAKNATDIDPDNVLVWENLSQIYQQLIGFVQGSSDWAIAAYGQAISLEPNNPFLRLELGSVYLGLKDYDQAQKLFESAIAQKPDWPNAHYNLAAVMKLKNQNAQALSELQIAAKLLDPASDDAKKVDGEIKDLQKLLPTPTPTPTPTPSK